MTNSQGFRSKTHLFYLLLFDDIEEPILSEDDIDDIEIVDLRARRRSELRRRVNCHIKVR